jgi:hypothetical protein
MYYSQSCIINKCYISMLMTLAGFKMVVEMVLNTTFNNSSVISWRSVLLVEETGVFREYNGPVASQ